MGGDDQPKDFEKVCIYILINAAFFVFFVHESSETCGHANELKCRPLWFGEIISAIYHVHRSMGSLALMTLTFFVEHSYEKYTEFYWDARAIQGAINTLCMLVGTNMDIEDRSEAVHAYRRNFERYITLTHVLCYRPVCPTLQGLSIKDLAARDILGIRLVNQEEVELLESSGAPQNTVLFWIS